MPGYVLRRTDQGGGYVAPPGSLNAYTKRLERARVFPTIIEAAQDRCPVNEVILAVDEIVRPGRS